MKTLLLSHLVLCSALWSYAAQPPAAPDNADRAWATLKSFGKPDSAARGNGATAAAPSRDEQAAKFIDQANQLRAFYTEFGSHDSAKEAKRLEALALNHAALNGDTSQDSRRLALIEDMRKDSALSASNRFEVVAWSRQVDIARLNSPNRAAYLSAQENATRDLITEFPDVAAGYDSLLGIARDSAPARGIAITRDLLKMRPPAHVGVEALFLADRLAFVGQPLATVLAQAGPNPLAAGVSDHATVIYAWSAREDASIRAIKYIAGLTRSVSFVGVNLDTDVEAAKTVAVRDDLPGEQYFDRGGRASPMAIALRLNRCPEVYLVDKLGVVRDVHGLIDFQAKVAALGQ